MIDGISRIAIAAMLLISQPIFSAAEATTVAPPAGKPHPSMTADKPVDAESLYQVESEWTGADDRKVSLSSLRGKVRVLAIFYSGCEFACPVIVGRMKSLQAALPVNQRSKVGFVLVSMDPEKDDPARLAEYAKRMELDDNWTLLKGDDADVRELAALLGFRYRQEADGEFAHSNMVSVLDREGRLVHQGVGLDSDTNETVQRITKLLEQ